MSVSAGHELPSAVAGRTAPGLRQRAITLARTPEYVFLWLALLFGLLYALVLPPFHVADEPSHFYRAYQIAHGGLVAQRMGDATGGVLPTSLDRVTGLAHDYQPVPGPAPRTLDQIAALFAIPLDRNDTVFIDFRNSALFAPVPYLPQALGIGLGSALNLPPVALLYLGRLAALASSVALVFLAIRRTPVFKWVFVLLALAPAVGNIRSSLSVDGPTISIALLLTACILYYAWGTQRPLQRRDMLLLVALAVLLALSKQVYFVICLLYFLIPVQRLGNWKRYLGFFAVLTAACATALLAWSLLVQNTYTAVEPGQTAGVPTPSSERPERSSNVRFDPVAQAQFIVTHPPAFAATVAGHLATIGPAHVVWSTNAIGWRLRMPMPLVALYLLVVFLVMLCDRRCDLLLRWRERALVGFTAIANAMLIIVVGYLMWNNVGASTIHGIHGRYFIPLLPLFALLFYNHWLSNRWPRLNMQSTRIQFATTAYCTFLSLSTLLFMLSSYYWWA